MTAWSIEIVAEIASFKRERAYLYDPNLNWSLKGPNSLMAASAAAIKNEIERGNILWQIFAPP